MEDAPKRVLTLCTSSLSRSTRPPIKKRQSDGAGDRVGGAMVRGAFPSEAAAETASSSGQQPTPAALPVQVEACLRPMSQRDRSGDVRLRLTRFLRESTVPTMAPLHGTTITDFDDPILRQHLAFVHVCDDPRHGITAADAAAVDADTKLCMEVDVQDTLEFHIHFFHLDRSPSTMGGGALHHSGSSEEERDGDEGVKHLAISTQCLPSLAFHGLWDRLPYPLLEY